MNHWFNNQELPILQAFEVCAERFKRNHYKNLSKIVTRFDRSDRSWFLKHLRNKQACDQDPKWKLPPRNKPRQSQQEQKEHIKNVNARIDALGPDATQMERDRVTKEYCDANDIIVQTFKSWDACKTVCMGSYSEIPKKKCSM